MTSIRRTLLVWLLATVAVAGALVAVGVYRTAYEEAAELFDYQLQQMGIALRDRIFEGGGGGGSGAEDFVIQVWRADGAVVFVSSARLVPPVRAPVGQNLGRRGLRAAPPELFWGTRCACCWSRTTP